MTERDVAAFRPTERFSDRVENYAKHRPGYPRELLTFLRDEMGLTRASVVADVGSGTGILSRMFLENGNAVYGVEPNREMREACERLLRDFPGFKSVAGAAEETSLPDSSVDLITAAQAFHWFDVARARREFKRILRPEGFVIIVWNTRSHDATPFLRAYEAMLLEFGEDYERVSAGYADVKALEEFFADGYERREFANAQHLEFEALRGRLLSASYAPLEDDPRHAPMIARLREIFDANEENGRVSFKYRTEVFYGRP